jgi:hypothetical protein
MRDKHWSKTDWERWLLATDGWWQDERWGIRKDRKTFREWANRLWAAAKRKHGPNVARDYNLKRGIV